jgi:hypothetical protein
MTKFWIALLLLPLIAGLHRYACNLGFRNQSHRVALYDALTVGVLMAGLITGIGLLLLAGCSSDSTRGQAPLSRAEERHQIIQKGQDFCAKYPDDLACPGRMNR